MAILSHTYLEPRYRAKLDLIAKQVELELITPRSFPFPYRDMDADFPLTCDYRVRSFPPLYPVGVRTSTRWLLNSFDLGFHSFKPEVIHVENEEHSFILLQAAIARTLFARRAKLIVFVWANVPLAGWRAWALKPLGRLMRRAIDLYLVGNEDAGRLLEQTGVQAARIRLLPQIGVEMETYRPPSATEREQARRHLGLTSQEIAVGYVGRLTPEKGIADLIDAAHRSSRTIRMLFVGDGPLRTSLGTLPDACVVSPGNATAVLRYYHAMDVFVLPSRTTRNWKEQFGRVLIEAMACGIPVVGSDSGAIPEVIGGAGFVFPEGDVPALAKILDELATNESLRKRASTDARRRAAAYSVDRIAADTLDAYSSLLGRKLHGTLASPG